jgi:ubiquinone/menaquinone biosynthesis C-methylase UbiE
MGCARRTRVTTTSQTKRARGDATPALSLRTTCTRPSTGSPDCGTPQPLGHARRAETRATPIRTSIYVPRVTDGTLTRSCGKVFNEIAAEYDRNRPTYPDALVDHACQVACIGAGGEVLEIGCGTGQLTRSLLARGLRVTALEPGDQLIAIAGENLEDACDVEFVNARLEDMQLPRERYQAVFSASAIHWADPDLSWRKIADVLAPGGTLALIQYLGLQPQRSADDQEDLLSAIRRHAPEIAATWPTYRDLESTIAGVQERRGNVSDAWSWLGSYDIGRDYAADLFEDVQLATAHTLIEHTADELNALLGTMSSWARLSPDQRDAITSENRALYARLARPIRASTLAGLVTARRRGCDTAHSSSNG